MDVIPLGNSTLLNAEQFLKIWSPIEVMESGRRIDCKEEHPKKAFTQIEMTEVGNFILARAWQPKKAPFNMNATDESSRLIVSKDRQLLKAYSPMHMTEVGILISFKDKQFLKAWSGIWVTVSFTCTRVTVISGTLSWPRYKNHGPLSSLSAAMVVGLVISSTRTIWGTPCHHTCQFRSISAL